MGTVGAEYSVRVWDRNGNTVVRSAGKSDSFVKNFSLLIESGIRNASITVKDTGGTNRSCLGFTCAGGSGQMGVDTHHIVIGTGNTPVEADNFNLAAKISNSVVEHGAVLVKPGAPYLIDGVLKSRVGRRSFVNKTESPVTVAEFGIVVQSGGYNILILRDVPETPIEIPGLGGMDVSYTFTVAVNSESGSFTRNFMEFVACSFDGNALRPVVDTGGVSRNIDFDGKIPSAAPGATHAYGILVGKSGNGNTGEEFALMEMIPHGLEDGNLWCSHVTITPTVVEGDTISFSVRRSFINLTPDPITVREVGLVAQQSGYNILLSRNVIDPIEIPPYDGVNVTITHRTVI